MHKSAKLRRPAERETSGTCIHVHRISITPKGTGRSRISAGVDVQMTKGSSSFMNSDLRGVSNRLRIRDTNKHFIKTSLVSCQSEYTANINQISKRLRFERNLNEDLKTSRPEAQRCLRNSRKPCLECAINGERHERVWSLRRWLSGTASILPIFVIRERVRSWNALRKIENRKFSFRPRSLRDPFDVSSGFDAGRFFENSTSNVTAYKWLIYEGSILWKQT
jgi:hypothetical protein